MKKFIRCADVCLGIVACAMIAYLNAFFYLLWLLGCVIAFSAPTIIGMNYAGIAWSLCGASMSVVCTYLTYTGRIKYFNQACVAEIRDLLFQTSHGQNAHSSASRVRINLINRIQ